MRGCSRIQAALQRTMIKPKCHLCQFLSQVHELTLVFCGRQQRLHRACIAAAAAAATSAASHGVKCSQHQHCQRCGARQAEGQRVQLTNI
jgi:hypothetical protein